MDNDKKNFWSILKADEIEDFMDLLDLARKILKRKIADIEIMAGGLTNKSFKLTFEDGMIVIMRLAGKGTGEYINRRAEKRNSTMAGDIGLAPEIYYFDEGGSQLVEFVKLPTMHIEDFQNDAVVLQEAAKALRLLHTSGIKFEGAFSPIAGIEEYAAILDQKGIKERFVGWDRRYEYVKRIRDAYAKNPPVLGPCHNDVLAENFMFDGKTMKVIDWEYGGEGDPNYDVSGLITENLLDDKATEVMMRAYFGGEPTDLQRAHVHVNKFIYCTYWSIWSMVQIANGKDHDIYWEYGEHRAKLGNEYLEDPNFDSYLSLIGG